MSNSANPMMVQPNANVANTSANAYNAAVNATNAAMNFAPNTLAGANVGQYMNPYTHNVINNNLRSLNEANQMALNNVGADATFNDAYGGSRQAVAAGITNTAFGNAANDMIANQNLNSFLNAQRAAQFDIGNQFNQQRSVLNAANQLGNLSQQGFNYNRDINSGLAQAGNQQQNLIQQIINAATGQFGDITGYGNTMLGLPLTALGAAPATTGASGVNTATRGYQPGIFDYLTLGANTLASIYGN